MSETLDTTSTMDAVPRMQKVAASSINVLVDLFAAAPFSESAPSVTTLPTFRSSVASRAASLLDQLRKEYLFGSRGNAPASRFLNKTRPVYEFVRLTLGIKMHGSENYTNFADGAGAQEISIGGSISLIQEAIRDGEMQNIIAGMFSA